MYSLLLCVLLSRLSENKAKLTDVPKNMAVLEGGTVTMRCSTDRSVKSGNDAPRWFREIFYRENKVFTGSQINKVLFPNYDINRTVIGQYDLMIDSVNTSHAGKYICQEISPSESYASWSSSELVVVIDDQSDISDFDAVYYNDQIGNLVALKLPPNKIGEDGTEYVQMNYEAANAPQLAAKPKLTKPVPSSAADVYAAIDHNMVLPSRGNKKRRK